MDNERVRIIKTVEGRTCCSCMIFKPWTDFHRDNQKLEGYYPNCKNCRKEKYLATYDADKQREKILKYNYGITIDEYAERLEGQGGCCAICGIFNDKQPLEVDHDSTCCPEGKSGARTCGNCVRGLICSNCNKGIGLLKHDINTLFNAITYLENYNV